MHNLKIKFYHLLFPFLALFIISSCTPDEVEEEAPILTDSWICKMESIVEKEGWYQLYLNENQDYLGVSSDNNQGNRASRIIKVSKEGLLLSNSTLSFSEEEKDFIKIYNDKIYRFYHSNNFNPDEKIKVQIYDGNGDLIDAHELDSHGVLIDVELESDNLVGMVIYNPDEEKHVLKKLHFTDGLIAETNFGISFSFPTNLHIVESGEYFLTGNLNNSTGVNLVFIKNDLSPIWSKNFKEFGIGDLKFIPNTGIYLIGFSSSGGVFKNHIARLDESGSLLNSFECEDENRWIMDMNLNNEKVCVMLSHPENGENLRLLFLDLELNLESTLEIEGNVSPSNLVLNELESFSFFYNLATDSDISSPSPDSNPRIFKLDDTYTLPTNVIVQ